jgi:hypothetical protein
MVEELMVDGQNDYFMFPFEKLERAETQGNLLSGLRRSVTNA